MLNQYYSLRLYKSCSHNQQMINIKTPMGKANRRKFVKEISNALGPSE